MWTDNETTTDLLGFKVHADLIRNVVTDQNLLPVVLGVFGDWGGGKSSIMQMIQKDLEHDEYNEVVCLYFNGWVFEGYEDAKIALLSSILVQLREHQRFGERVKDSVGSLLKRVNYMEVLKTGGIAGLKYGIPLLITYLTGGAVPPLLPVIPDPVGETSSPAGDDESKDASEKSAIGNIDWAKLIKESNSESGILEIRKFRDDFQKMLEETNIESLVILIDDLDRCLPERIIETLEAIKLFVLVPRTAFVIGADPRIVRHAIGTRYVTKQFGDRDTSKIEVDELIKDYLEKLIQIPYQLPRLSPSEIESYINLLACQKFLDENDSKRVLEDWSAKRSQNFYSAYQLAAIRQLLGADKLTPALEEQLTWSGTIAHVLTEGLKGNPRQVKRMLNALLLRKKLAEVASIEIKDDVLAKLMVLEYAHLSRFYELNDWQASEEGKPVKLKKLEENAREVEDAEPITAEDKISDWQTPSIQTWLKIEPAIKDVDLRDYFWLARDRTSSTLAGVNMVSPIVRRLFKGLIEGNEGEQEVAAKQTVGLDEPDREALIGLIQRQMITHPGQPAAFDAMLKLAENNIEGSSYIFVKTVGDIEPAVLSPTIAPKLQILSQIESNLAGDVDELLENFRKNHPKTAIGRAASRGD